MLRIELIQEVSYKNGNNANISVYNPKAKDPTQFLNLYLHLNKLWVDSWLPVHQCSEIS